MTRSSLVYGAIAEILTPPSGDPAPMGVLGLPAPDPSAFAEEHVLLFGRAGPARVSPYEGAHRPAALHDVLASYAEIGFRIDPGFRDRPDHACAELAVMAGLARDEERLEERRDPEARQAATRAARGFFRKRLQPWLPRFFEGVAAAERAPHHRALARFAGAFLQREGRRLEVGRAQPCPPTPAPQTSCRECGMPLGFPLPDSMESLPRSLSVCTQCRVRADLRRLKA